MEIENEVFVTAKLEQNKKLMTVKCPFCGKEHTHGTEGKGSDLNFPTHRISHCSSDSNAVGKGYTITGFMPENKKVLLDWNQAFIYFDNVRRQYQELAGTPGVNTAFALEMVFRPIAERYERGERTVELFAEVISVE